MKNIFQPEQMTLTLITILGISTIPALATDLNLSGGANININPVNNNKYSTPLKSFSPGSVPLDHVDLTPLGTPPAQSELQMYFGGKPYIMMVDKDIKNAKEAKESRRQQGLQVSNGPEIPEDDAKIDDSDIQDFLGSYYKYLHTEGLSSGSLPVVPINDPTPKIEPPTKGKQTSSIDGSESKGLQAKEQKLLISKTPSAKAGEIQSSP